MGLFHEDKVYGIKIRESANDGSDFSNPEADYRLAFIGEDGLWHLKDAVGTVTSPGGMTNPMTTAGDLIYGGASGTPTRVGIGTAGQVLKVNAGATAVEWGAAGGGGGWTLGIDESGASFANFTSHDGTWASTGSIIQQTSGTSANHEAGITAIQPYGTPAIMQVECRAPSSGQSTNANMSMGLFYGAQATPTSGYLGAYIRWDSGAASSRIVLDSVGSANLATKTSMGLVYDTWYTIRLLCNGGAYSMYIDGTLHINAYHALGNTTVFSLGLGTGFGMKADFRNLKVWYPTQPA